MKTFVLRNDEVRLRAGQYLGHLDLQPQLLECVIQPHMEMRNLDQHAAMWASLTDLAEQVKWYGEYLTPENWKDVLTASLKKQKAVPGVDGGFVVLGTSTRKMTKLEMSELIDLIHAFGAEHGVKFTEPKQ